MAQPPTTVRHGSLTNPDCSDDDTVSLLSEPGNPKVIFRRRGGRRRGRSEQGYHPLRMSLGQVTTEAKACFPVYGCASFLLSLLVAAIFVVPPPSRKSIANEDFALLPCRRKVWENFGYMVLDEEDNDDVSIISNNRTTKRDWSWFLQQVDETDTLDRCRNEKEGAPTVPRFCDCNNPTKPGKPEANLGDDDDAVEYAQLWDSTFTAHQTRLKNESVLPPFTDLELVLVGDSLIEHWMGTSIGRHKPIYDGVTNVFQTTLRDNHEKRPYIHTTPFGISGDRCSQALYRIQNGAVIPTEPRLGILTVL